MAVKVYVCINDLSLGENQKNFSQHLSILEAFLNALFYAVHIYVDILRVEKHLETQL